MATLGIDLGTTFSAAASFVGGIMTPINQENGKELLESMVSFTANGTYQVGVINTEYSADDPWCKIYDVKRMIGRRLNDKEVQSLLPTWPFRLTEQDNEIVIHVKTVNGVVSYTPIQVSSIILRKLKDRAEAQLGQALKRTVVTVPARFGSAPREATKKACELAGLPQCNLLDEPSAAALEYCQTTNVPDGSFILVYDLGGGTFDLSLVQKLGAIIDVVGKGGDTALGGRDFDKNLMDLMRKRFEDKYNCNLENDKKAMYRLQVRCEQAKRQLSNNMTTLVTVPNFHESRALNEKVSRAQFEECNIRLFDEIMKLTRSFLEEKHIGKDELYAVCVVGGSSKMPRIHAQLTTYFGSSRVKFLESPDLMVAAGAARRALKIEAFENNETSATVIRDVNPYDLGVEMFNGDMAVLIKEGTHVPTKSVHYAATVQTNQTTMEFFIFEGNERRARDNKLLGRFVLDGLPEAPAQKLLVALTCEYTSESILKVSAKCTRNGKTKCLQVNLIDAKYRNPEQNQTNPRQTGQVNRIDLLNELKFLVLQSYTSPFVKNMAEEIKRWISEKSDQATVTEIQMKLTQMTIARQGAVLLPDT